MEFAKFHVLPNGTNLLELPNGKYIKVDPDVTNYIKSLHGNIQGRILKDLVGSSPDKSKDVDKDLSPEPIKSEEKEETASPDPEPVKSEEKEESAPPSSEPKPEPIKSEEKEESAPPSSEPKPEPPVASGGAGGAWSVIVRNPKADPSCGTTLLTNQEIHDLYTSQSTTPYKCGVKPWDFRDIVFFLLMKALVFPINGSLFNGDKRSDTYMKYGRVASTTFRKKVYDTFHFETESARTVGELINMFSDCNEMEISNLRTSIAQAVSVIASAQCQTKWHKPHCTFKHKKNESELFQWTSTVLNNIVRKDTDVLNVFKKVFGEHMCSDRNKMSHIFNVIIVTITEIVGSPRTHPKISLDFSGTTPDVLGMSDYKMDCTFQRLCYDHAIDDDTPSNDGY